MDYVARQPSLAFSRWARTHQTLQGGCPCHFRIDTRKATQDACLLNFSTRLTLEKYRETSFSYSLSGTGLTMS